MVIAMARRAGGVGAPVGAAARAWNYLRRRGSSANRAAAGRAFRATSYLARLGGRGGTGAGGSGSSGG